MECIFSLSNDKMVMICTGIINLLTRTSGDGHYVNSVCLSINAKDSRFCEQFMKGPKLFQVAVEPIHIYTVSHDELKLSELGHFRLYSKSTLTYLHCRRINKIISYKSDA